MDPVELIGYTGSSCLALCGLPQAIKCVRTKRADDLSSAFILLWFFGEVLLLAYTLIQLGWVWPLLLNYGFNLLIVCVIMRVKFAPKPT